MDPAPAAALPRHDVQHRDTALHGARGIAAMSIVLLHAGIYSAAFGQFGDRLELWRHLNSGVSVFFVLSGYLLYAPFVRAHAEGRSAPRVVAYAARRALRIFPGYWLALITTLLVFELFSLQTGHYDGIHTVVRGVSWFGLFDKWDISLQKDHPIPQSWTLDVELFFYMSIPVVAAFAGLVIRRLRTTWLRAELLGIGLVVLISSGIKIIGAMHSGVVNDGEYPYMGWPLIYLDGFAIGMIAAVITVHRERGGTLPSPLRLLLSPATLWLAWLTLLIGTFALLRTEDTATLFMLWKGPRFLAEYVAFIGLGALLVLPVILGGRGVTPVRRALSLPPIQMLGTISFGIYVWHYFVLDMLRKAGLSSPGNLSGYVVWVLLTTAGTCVIATISWHLVEKPALKLKRHFPHEGVLIENDPLIQAEPQPAH